MTSNADFKRLVRERMTRTGERYTAARAHLLAGRAGPADAAPGLRVGGRQPDVAAVANALARSGVRGVTGEPVDEVDVFGLAGGIGFMVAVFVYEGFGPTMTITTRTVSMPDPFIAEALVRAGATVEVHTTGSAAVAARRLDAALAAGHAVVCSVEASALPYEGTDLGMVGAGPRVVGVLGLDGDDLLVDDRSVTPLRVPTERLAAARAAVPKVRHHSVVVTGPVDDHDPVAAAVDGLRRTLVGYDEPPAKPFARNVGTAGLRTWAARLTDSSARGWARTFAEPVHLHHGLRRLYECIEHELTAPHASRGLYATWLRRVGDVAGLDLDEVAGAVEGTQVRFGRIAELVADADPSVRDAVDVLESSRRLLDEEGSAATDDIVAMRSRLAALQRDATLGGSDAAALFAAIAAEATAIADEERGALDRLAALLG